MPTTTTDKYDLTGSSPLRSYVWRKLQDELGWNKAESGNLIPVTLPQQQPQFNDYSAPYMVYRWSLQPSGDDFYMREEQVAFSIYSNKEEEIRRAINMMDNFLNRYDWTARDINEFLRTDPSITDKYKKFDFKYCYIVSASGPQPAATEAGRMDGMVIVRICYTVDIDNDGIRK